MKIVHTTAAQGDVLFRRVTLPKGALKKLEERFEGQARKVVAHSETGHHHVIDDAGVRMYQGEDPFVAYLLLESTDHADVVHRRDFDTHGTLRLSGKPGTVWEARRPREHVPWSGSTLGQMLED